MGRQEKVNNQNFQPIEDFDANRKAAIELRLEQWEKEKQIRMNAARRRRVSNLRQLEKQALEIQKKEVEERTKQLKSHKSYKKQQYIDYCKGSTANCKTKPNNNQETEQKRVENNRDTRVKSEVSKKAIKQPTEKQRKVNEKNIIDRMMFNHTSNDIDPIKKRENWYESLCLPPPLNSNSSSHILTNTEARDLNKQQESKAELTKSESLDLERKQLLKNHNIELNQNLNAERIRLSPINNVQGSSCYSTQAKENKRENQVKDGIEEDYDMEYDSLEEDVNSRQVKEFEERMDAMSAGMYRTKGYVYDSLDLSKSSEKNNHNLARDKLIVERSKEVEVRLNRPINADFTILETPNQNKEQIQKETSEIAVLPRKPNVAVNFTATMSYRNISDMPNRFSHIPSSNSIQATPSIHATPSINATLPAKVINFQQISKGECENALNSKNMVPKVENTFKPFNSSDCQTSNSGNKYLSLIQKKEQKKLEETDENYRVPPKEMTVRPTPSNYEPIIIQHDKVSNRRLTELSQEEARLLQSIVRLDTKLVNIREGMPVKDTIKIKQEIQKCDGSQAEIQSLASIETGSCDLVSEKRELAKHKIEKSPREMCHPNSMIGINRHLIKKKQNNLTSMRVRTGASGITNQMAHNKVTVNTNLAHLLFK